MIKLNTEYVQSKFLKQLPEYLNKAKNAHNVLHSSDEYKNITGWLDIADSYDKAEFEKIKICAEKIRKDSDILLVLGIGGSYLGAKCAIEFLYSQFYNSITSGTQIYFLGNNLSADYLNTIIKLCENKDVSVNVISKSGGTVETSIAFRVLKEYMEKRYSDKAAKERIYVTTDISQGSLRKTTEEMGYESFSVPRNIGGRYSVLSAVGLLPIAVSGADIDKLMNGAKKAQNDCYMADNDCYKYAAIRNILYNNSKTVEVFASYEPAVSGFGEWLKQLFGESEGKNKKGIFPASVSYTTDLHSLGQYMQEGLQNKFETVLWFDTPKSNYTIKRNESDFDGLNYLAGKDMHYINEQAKIATTISHFDADVPNILMNIEKIDEESLGYMFYFFEKACAISAIILGVNPFDQPGVEGYKQNMFALLGRNGYEDKQEKLLKRLTNSL